MRVNPSYTLHHPKWYRRPVSVWWWLENWSYARFVLRELSSIFVAFVAVLCLWELRSLSAGPEAYARFLARLKNPLVLALNGISFVFVLFHAITWFNLAPKAMVFRLSGKRVPDVVVSGLNYLAWVTASVFVAWILLGG
jgi:fumarate reductase subunit C